MLIWSRFIFLSAKGLQLFHRQLFVSKVTTVCEIWYVCRKKKQTLTRQDVSTMLLLPHVFLFFLMALLLLDELAQAKDLLFRQHEENNSYFYSVDTNRKTILKPMLQYCHVNFLASCCHVKFSHFSFLHICLISFYRLWLWAGDHINPNALQQVSSDLLLVHHVTKRPISGKFIYNFIYACIETWLLTCDPDVLDLCRHFLLFSRSMN